MVANPTFVLVPGMWHRPAFFTKLRDNLSKRGFPSVAIDMPSSAFGTNTGVVSREPDIEAIASVIRTIISRGEDVIIVMHSFGGISGAEAAGRVLEEEEEEEEATSHRGQTQEARRGGRGKIRRLVYVAAFVGAENEPVPIIQSVVHEYAADFFDVQENGILTCNPRAKSWFYGDELSPAEQEKHFRSLHTNPIAPFLEPVRSAAWKQIPSTYVYSTVDRPMPFPMMKYMVQQARDTVVAAAEEQGEFAAEQLENVFGGELGEFHVDAPHCAIFLAPERVQEVGEILVTVAEGSR